MSGDWADERAQQWIKSLGGRLEGPGPIGEAYGWLEVSDENAASLAALLREVESEEHACGDHIKARLDEQMAEVRRVVEECVPHLFHSRCTHCEILRRLEAL